MVPDLSEMQLLHYVPIKACKSFIKFERQLITVATTIEIYNMKPLLLELI